MVKVFKMWFYNTIWCYFFYQAKSNSAVIMVFVIMIINAHYLTLKQNKIAQVHLGYISPLLGQHNVCFGTNIAYTDWRKYKEMKGDLTDVRVPHDFTKTQELGQIKIRLLNLCLQTYNILTCSVFLIATSFLQINLW